MFILRLLFGIIDYREFRNENKEEGIKTELLRFAFTGINVVPSVMLILMQLYWLVAAFGIMEDFEADELPSLFSGLAAFLEGGKVPSTWVFSLLVTNFWTLMMLLYFLPIKEGGLISAILAVPAVFISIYTTKLVLVPLKKIFDKKDSEHDIGHKVISKECRLLTDLKHGMIGQAEIKQKGPSLVINVKVVSEEDVFLKNDTAFVVMKDDHKDLYYILKA